MRPLVLLLLTLFLAAVVSAGPFFVFRTHNDLPDQWLQPAKRALDKCGCNMGCFYSSARECMSCCALAL